MRGRNLIRLKFHKIITSHQSIPSPMEVVSATGEGIRFNRVEFNDLHSELPVCVLSVTAPGRSTCLRLLASLLAAAVAVLSVATCTTWLAISGSILTIVASLAVFVTFLLTLLYAQCSHKDTVVVVRNVGIQLSTEKWGGFKQSRFIPHSDVHDIIIHEAITMHRVIFYLALLLHTKRDTQHVEISELTSVPLFEDFKPRLATLREAYSTIRRTLSLECTEIPSQ